MRLNGIDGRPLHLVGIAVPYNTWININGSRERIAPGAFRHQAPSWNRIGLHWKHDDFQIANTSYGSLKIHDTPAGLFFRATLPANMMAVHVSAMAANGVLGASIQFRTTREDADGTVRGAILEHIGVYTETAYPTCAWRGDLGNRNLSPEAQAWRAHFDKYQSYVRRSAAQDRDAVPSPTPTRRPAARGASPQGDRTAHTGYRGAARRSPSVGAALARGLGARRARDDNLADDEQLARDLGITLEDLRRMRQHERAAADPMRAGLV